MAPEPGTGGLVQTDQAATAKFIANLHTIQSQIDAIWNSVEHARDTVSVGWQGATARAFNDRINEWEEEFKQLEQRLNRLGQGIGSYREHAHTVDQENFTVANSWANG